MRVGLYVTCLVDLMRPRIGFAALELLECAGLRSVRAADADMLRPAGIQLGRLAARACARAQSASTEFEGCDYVVAPSGSCAGMIRTHYPDLFRDDPHELPRALQHSAQRTYELTDFLVNVAEGRARPGRFPRHDHLSRFVLGLRELGVKSPAAGAARAKVPGLTLVEMASRKHAAASAARSPSSSATSPPTSPSANAPTSQRRGADAVVLGDLGCMLNIEGRLRRRGDSQTRVLHVAEVLAGKT